MVTRTVPMPSDLDGHGEPSRLAALLGALLLEADDVDEGSRVVGIERLTDELRLHVAPLPHDERAGAAGLFGMRAAPSWSAVAEVVVGRARHLEDGALLGAATGVIVVDRHARVASQLHVEGHDLRGADGRDVADPGMPVGLVVDALHRMLGLPSPGAPPPPAMAALAVWGQALLLHTFEHGAPDWRAAVALHPGDPGAAHVASSTETVVAATIDCGGDLDWERMHRRAVHHGAGPPDLRPDEVAWMDATLYARWVIGSMPDPATVAEVLHAHGAEHTAHQLLAVTRAVLEQLGP